MIITRKSSSRIDRQLVGHVSRSGIWAANRPCCRQRSARPDRERTPKVNGLTANGHLYLSMSSSFRSMRGPIWLQAPRNHTGGSALLMLHPARLYHEDTTQFISITKVKMYSTATCYCDETHERRCELVPMASIVTDAS